jgi:hypothetical protein
VTDEGSVQNYIILSVVGALLILLMVVIAGGQGEPERFRDRTIIGVAIIASCVLGVSLAVRPNWIKGIMRTGRAETGVRTLKDNRRARKGHHPDCPGFEDHTIIIGRKTMCSGCSGLLLGCIGTAILSLIYIILYSAPPLPIMYLLFLLGLFLVWTNLVETALPMRSPTLHVSGNVLFVIGLFLVITGVFSITANLGAGIFAVIISFLWLDTRIAFSNKRHKQICVQCRMPCKAY